jgi:Tol biopolymer transport system component
MLKTNGLLGLKKVTVIIILSLFHLVGFSQFYNGHQMKFGKNRVQFEEFEWYYYRFNRFDTYFYAGSTDVALRTAEFANKSIVEIENLFEFQLKQRIIFVIYQNLSDFRQSNIGLDTGDEQYNIGGVLKVIDNIAFLYVEGDIVSLEEQVKSSIANIILNEMIFGSNIRNKIANNTLVSIPEWYIKGLASYVSTEWNSEMENINKNGILSNNFKDFNQLTGDNAAIAGRSIWNYVAVTYGAQVIPNIVYMTRLTKNIESGFLYVLGLTLNELQTNWIDFYKSQYNIFDYLVTNPNSKSLLKKTRKNVEYYQLYNSPNSQKVAWAENKMGKYCIKIKDTETNKIKTIYRRGHKLVQITDYSYPIIRWHPSGAMLGFIIEKKGEIFYTTYNLENKEIKEIQINALEKITSFNYSHDGMTIVFSAFNVGQSDLFLFNIAANTFENITQDNADDYDPSFINNSKQIIFTSKRATEEIGSKRNNIVKTQKYNDVFVYDIESKKISQITNSSEFQEKQAFYKNGKYTFLSDENGISNLYSAQIDSTISFIDTVTHYRHFLNKNQLTNYQYSILNFSQNRLNDENAFLYKQDNKYKLYYDKTLPSPVEFSQKTVAQTLKENNNRRETLEKQKTEIPQNIVNEQVSEPLDIPVNINNYSLSNKTKPEKDNNEEFDENGTAKAPRMGKYFTTFYTNYLVSQVDFGFLSNSYQSFTGDAFYFNPGVNLILKVGTSDLFEDYRITAGARLPVDFNSSEYLLSFENLKKRWNKQLILHRQSIVNIVGNVNYVKTLNHEAFYIMRYPISQVNALQFTANLRQNRHTYLSIDNASLEKPNEYEYWGSLKAEYIFDNTNELSINILSGVRFKAFGEAFKQLNNKNTDMFVTGLDFRYYQPIHKNLIFATRFASSYSFGSAKLIYYLGGIDNWISFSKKNPMFDEYVRINPDINYVYQAVATNMRGFSQNIRNGTNFAVLNNEIRFPVVSYFYTKPIQNEFFKNLQIIGFFDVGSAWSGATPFSGTNAYENDIYDLNSISVIIQNDNFPIVYGYGIGARSKLFGYFVRVDWAWGLENNIILPRMFYFSLGLDF